MSSRKALELNLKAALALGRATGVTILSGSRMIAALSLGRAKGDTPEMRKDVLLWASEVCRSFGIRTTLQGEELDNSAGILVCNHMSYLDVPVLCAVEPMSFVAKDSVKNWPFVGPAAEGFGVIYIDRSSEQSRKNTGDSLREAVQDNKRRVVVFPEGTTSLRGLPWRAGVFKLAQENKIPMQAASICYRPAKYAAFEINSMMEHMMRLPEGGPIEAVITIGPRFMVTDFLKDCEDWEKWNKEVLSNELSLQGIV